MTDKKKEDPFEAKWGPVKAQLRQALSAIERAKTQKYPPAEHAVLLAAQEHARRGTKMIDQRMPK